MNTTETENINNLYQGLQKRDHNGVLNPWRREGFDRFSRFGLPTLKNEEWKYTGISRLFKTEYTLCPDHPVDKAIIEKAAIPHLKDADHLVFINGVYSEENSDIKSYDEIEISSLEDATMGEHRDLVMKHFGKSSEFNKDGIDALNMSLMESGAFIFIKRNHSPKRPIYFNQIFDATENHLLASPRTLVVVEENAQIEIIESYHTIGSMDSFSNEVMEVIVNENAIVDLYKIQNDNVNANHAGTTHIRQIGKCLVQSLVVTLNGGMIRNNTDVIMEAAGNEAHLYGLYFLKGNTHVDNHTIVDNAKPNCYSNELYKGVIDDSATGIFSGKIYVRPDAQKIDAYQTNNNILLSDHGTVNTKPQLEIYADDVKCSHGATVGRLDEEALYYCRSRGINEQLAKSMLLNAFAQDIIEKVKVEPLKDYLAGLIKERLQIED